MMIFTPHTETDFEIANSYLSVADANDIILKQRNSGDWENLEDEKKEMLLMQYSMAIDGAFMYANAKTSFSQILKFPRNGAKTLPNSIRFALALMVMESSVSSAENTANDTGAGATTSGNIKREKIGKHEIEYFQDVTEAPHVATGAVSGKVSSGVISFLAPLRAITLKVKIGNSFA